MEHRGGWGLAVDEGEAQQEEVMFWWNLGTKSCRLGEGGGELKYGVRGVLQLR